ncbi:MAG: MBL fold metallo-hydrolase [Clostridia bacterium]|nr:MBL fold metallo-hydrolase [Clostridia bacterium]
MRTLTKMTPFRMIGNLYFVGTKEASSHLIDTGNGLILIDTGYEETAEVIVESMHTLGFDIKDVKYILHSHGHSDHTDGTATLLQFVPNAKTYLSLKDVKYIKGFTPDFDIRDGDVIKLGNTEIRCLFTPGHTEGTVSFFFDVSENGQTYRAAMFGGSGTKQLRKGFMNKRDVPYLCRGLFFDSIERLLGEKVDVMIGNHTWQNHTLEKYEKMATAETNPFIDPLEWASYLQEVRQKLWDVILQDSRERFVTYAHRGASHYCPENTFMSFYMGVRMGANGIETDVQRTKDGVLVLFHDDTLERVTGEAGKVADYTYAELRAFAVKKGNLWDKIPTFEDFLAHFADRDITFAIELKVDDTEKDVADMIFQYGVEKKTVVTSFDLERIRKIKAYAPLLRVGYLTKNIDGAVIKELIEIGADEICPPGYEVTPQKVDVWHRIGFNVRAWKISDETVMKQVYDAHADGMTVNFPDLLLRYIAEVNET